jgi:hypothetical protein
MIIGATISITEEQHEKMVNSLYLYMGVENNSQLFKKLLIEKLNKIEDKEKENE